MPDARLDKLSEMYNPKKTTPAVIEFVDIAGLVKGASKGAGVIEMVCCICYKITGHMDTAVHHCLNGGVIQQLL